MNDQKSNVGKWLAGILATIISGVIVYHLTDGRSTYSPPATSTSSTTPMTLIKGEEEKVKPKVEIRESESSKLIGTWRATGVEFGQPYDITWHARPDGTDTYFISNGYQSLRQDGAWQYSDGVLHETFPNGASGKSAVEMVDINHFVLTVIDNGVPAYTGIERHYYRQ